MAAERLVMDGLNMGVPVFLADGESLRASNQITLDGDEGHHAAAVRRVAPGEEVALTDGAGHVAHCVVVGADRRSITCDVHTRTDAPAPRPRIVVAQAIPKGDRGETAVETMTEVGVDQIIPWSAARCMVRWKGERGDKALRRWRSTAREASKQARRPWMPEIHEPLTTEKLAERVRSCALGIVLHEEAAQPIGSLQLPVDGDVVVVVGPEGGVTTEELTVLEQAGAEPVQLGPSVLRTSTAGTVAAGVLLAGSARWARSGHLS